MKTPEVTEMIKKMSFKEKVSYIWDYYKIHIIIGLALIIGITSFVHGQIVKPKAYYNISYIGDYINPNYCSLIQKDLNKTILNNDKKNSISVDSIFIDKNSIQQNPYALQKLAARISAKDLDFAIVNKKFFDTNFSSGMFYNLQSLKGFSSLSKDNYEFITKTNSSGHLGVYGISAKNSTVLNKLHFPNNDNMLVVISSSERKDKALGVINALLKK
ncbi:hypothetical protein [Clostridium hydrogenum]|uniref:hypothetical protein n=1 Tax=Clostridium hydrogenum TaxID=2855764 RepID=UPI001F2D55D4|nr:hypothetical protein [Clostridium hydrogenum]